MKSVLATFALAVASIVVGSAGCSDDAQKLTVEKLQDPNTCTECHATHTQQWSGSMHAYASDDPVFVAMNARGQRDTGGKLGDFCVKCHAPMAVRLGLTDGTSFDPTALPPEARGVTCYFCHAVTDVTDDHNAALALADDQTMRGGIAKPVNSPAHFSAGTGLLDSNAPDNQSKLCGACHDLVVPEHLNGVPGGVPLELSYAEWRTTIFATSTTPGAGLTCGGCHMKSSTDVVADAPGLAVPVRENGFHDHKFPAIDLALTPFPEQAEQAAAVQGDLDPSIGVIGTAPAASNRPTGGICLTPNNGDEITVRIDNLGAGHSWPSGASHDRRTWLEVIAYDASGAVVFSSGIVPDRVDPEAIADPNLLAFYDRAKKTDGTPAHFFYDVASTNPQVLKAAITLDRNDPAFDHSVTKVFSVPGLRGRIDRITTRVLVRPFPFATLQDLVDSGDLDPAVLDRVPTLSVGGAAKTWTAATQTTDGTHCNRFP